MAGLMASTEQSWLTCLDALELNEPGEIFTAAILAFRCHDVKKIQTVVEAGLTNNETEKGLVSALGWLPEIVGDGLHGGDKGSRLDISA